MINSQFLYTWSVFRLEECGSLDFPLGSVVDIEVGRIQAYATSKIWPTVREDCLVSRHGGWAEVLQHSGVRQPGPTLLPSQP